MSNSTQGASHNSPHNTNQPDDCRAAFELEFQGRLDLPPCPILGHLSVRKWYENHDTQMAWNGFQAARKPKRESVNLRALAARLSETANAVITFPDWGSDTDTVQGRQIRPDNSNRRRSIMSNSALIIIAFVSYLAFIAFICWVSGSAWPCLLVLFFGGKITDASKTQSKDVQP